MSATYSFVCPSTKKCVWVGQRGAGSVHPWIYSDEGIAQFLNHHIGLPILFVDDFWFENQSEHYEEWKPTPTGKEPPMNNDTPSAAEVAEHIKAMAVAFNMSHATCGDSAYWIIEFERQYQKALAASKPPAGLDDKLKNMMLAHLDGVYRFSARTDCDELVTRLIEVVLAQPPAGAAEVDEERLGILAEALIDTVQKHTSRGDVPLRTALCRVLRPYLRTSQPLAGEPAAMRYGWDGYGYQYIDNGAGSDWMTRHPDAEPLYASEPAPAQVTPEQYEALNQCLESMRQTNAALLKRLEGADICKVRETIRNSMQASGMESMDAKLFTDDAVIALHKAGYSIVRDTAQQPET